MSKATLAGAVMIIVLGGCGPADRPEQPSPGADTEVTVPAAPGGTPLFAAPGALPAAERHFELYQRMSEERAPLIKASFSPAH
jgi:hypothetical protein